MTTTRRYPFTALAAAMGLSESAAARQLRVSGSTEQAYRRDGMSEHVAERLALAAGFHPYEVWSEMRDDHLADVAAAAEAARERNRVRMRAHYAANSERVRAARRRYYQQAREYELARERRRYQANRDELLAHRRARRAAQRAATTSA